MGQFQDIMDMIQPEQVGRLWFRGRSPTPQSRIFGGQVLAQCLMAANATVTEEKLAHSMHAYFLRAGDPTSPVEFEVDPIRDGSSFATRRVVARQHGKAIFNTSVSFQIVEDGFQHVEPMPRLAAPTDTDVDAYEASPSKRAAPLLDLYGVRRLPPKAESPEEKLGDNAYWFRTMGSLEGDQRLHQAALVLISDFALLSTAFYRQNGNLKWQNYVIASLDHAIWFHAPIDMNDFLFYRCDSPWAGNARGFNRGNIWSSDGTLLASTTQEGLMREKTR